MVSRWLSPFRQSLRSRLLSDPFYRFQTIEELELAATLGIRIDVNRATVDDWLRLPGLSIHQARSLVQLTQSGLQLYSLDDIAAVLGITSRHLQAFAPILLFCHYDAESISYPQRINPNCAPLQELQTILPIDSDLATRIINLRSTGSKFKNLVDFQTRLQLSNDQIALLMHYLSFS